MRIAVERSSPKTSESAARTSRARPPAPLLVQRRTMTPARPPAEPARATLERAFGAELFAATAIPAPVRGKMEAAFGADFSGVRVHPRSSRAAELGALAYTQGSDIHMAPGQWAPETRQGQELLGHELAHVVQQRQGRVQATAQYKGVALNDDAALEAEADALGARAAQGASAAPPARTGAPSPAGGQVSQAYSRIPRGPVLQCAGGWKRKSTLDAGSAPKRTAFWGSTQQSITLRPGEHRRHIIPSSLFVAALTAWKNYWENRLSPAQIDHFEEQYGTWQDLYEILNNYRPNLIPGPGRDNSAIGMYMHSSEQAIDAARAAATDADRLTSLTTGMSRFSGFQQDRQRSLFDPVLPLVDSAGSFSEGAELATDLHDNAGFDWPYGGARHFDRWQDAYIRFANIKSRPGDFAYGAFNHAIRTFLELPHP
ncbi:eCIS core domain-containing protein [Sorangium sp. So ce385]|uniref:eCIS core domain-containing protein n=1 Tax=Sorangium sp. So ce385 TaxID=3133308 RepID=UPI003F5BF1EF